MGEIGTAQEYDDALKRIRRLQERLKAVAVKAGTLSPEVLALSQKIDEYVVAIHHYWQKNKTDQAAM